MTTLARSPTVEDEHAGKPQQGRQPIRRVRLLLPEIKITSLPTSWKAATVQGFGHGYKIDVMGRDLGGYGKRRIVIRAQTAWQPDDMVQARVMETTQFFPDKTLTYQYLILDPPGRTSYRGNIPMLSWNLVSCPLELKTRGLVEIEDECHWHQSIDCLKYDDEEYVLGILAITDEDNPISVYAEDDGELLFVE